MGTYFNCGALVNNARVKTKKQLRELLETSPSSVIFDGTSMFDSVSGYRGDSIPEGVVLVVMGPDPYTSRKWDANVKNVGGKVKLT